MQLSRIHGELAGGALLTSALARFLSSGSERVFETIAVSLLAYLPVVVALTSRFHGRSSIGWPNRVTLLRASGTCALAGLLLQPEIYLARGWLIVGLVLGLLALDGIDGWLARRVEACSVFGARFDMETDAALIVVLCLALWLSGLAPFWVLAIGLMRPAFIVAGRALPWLSADLPERFRRKLVCVVQVAALPAALLPAFDQGLRLGLLAIALLALVYSFTVDIVWLYRHRQTPPSLRRTP